LAVSAFFSFSLVSHLLPQAPCGPRRRRLLWQDAGSWL